MRKIIAALAVTVGLLVGVSAPAGAAPSPTNTVITYAQSNGCTYEVMFGNWGDAAFSTARVVSWLPGKQCTVWVNELAYVKNSDGSINHTYKIYPSSSGWPWNDTGWRQVWTTFPTTGFAAQFCFRRSDESTYRKAVFSIFADVQNSTVSAPASCISPGSTTV